MSSDYPGEFEQMLMLVILQLGDEAYGARIRERLAEEVGREPSAGALYTTLSRLERKGLLRGRSGDSSQPRLVISSKAFHMPMSPVPPPVG